MGHPRSPRSVPPGNFLFEPLTLNGAVLAGTNGDMEAILGTLLAPVVYEWKVQPGTRIDLFHFHIVLIDATVEAVDFGAISALPNGLLVQVVDDAGVIHDLTAGRTVKRNADWGLLAAGGISEGKGSGDDSLTIDWEVHGEDDISLHGGGKVQIIVRDNLTALTSFQCDIQARKYTEND